MNEREDSSEKQDRLVEGVDYYFEGGLMVLTAAFLRKRGYCCGNGCRHCPYPKEDQRRNSSSSL
ncbi:MAG: hypothetical protein H0V76_04505 [Blastocatellia bacterium]|nr:hypothetical protein [Blastocatellia bacterium]